MSKRHGEDRHRIVPSLSVFMDYVFYPTGLCELREFAFSLRYMRHVTDTRGASAVRGVVSEE